MNTILAKVRDASGRKRGIQPVSLVFARNQPISVNYQNRNYLATGKFTTSPTGERVFEMMARDYFIERLLITANGKQLWLLQPLAL
jgi:hypothetical protein